MLVVEEKPIVRAFATREVINDVDGYSIHITLGTLHMIHDFLWVFLSDEDLFDSIGTSSCLMKMYTMKMTNYEDLIKNLSENPVSVFDEERKELLYFLFVILGKFICLHEFHHIKNGHVDYITEQNLSGDSVPSLDYQTLEMDADACSICDLYDEYIRRVNGHDPQIPIQLRSHDKIVYVLGFCKLLMLTSFRPFSMDIDMATKSTHPYAFLRFDMMMATIATKLHSLSMTDDNVQSALNQLSASLVNFYATHYKVVEEQEFGDVIWSVDNPEEFNKLVMGVGWNWNKLRPKLERYAFGDLPALFEG